MISYSMLTVTGGSSINDNTAATVSPPASLSPLISSWLVRQGAIGALRKIVFAMLELGEDAALAYVCPIAARRKRLRDFFFHADGDERLEHRWQHRSPDYNADLPPKLCAVAQPDVGGSDCSPESHADRCTHADTDLHTDTLPDRNADLPPELCTVAHPDVRDPDCSPESYADRGANVDTDLYPDTPPDCNTGLTPELCAVAQPEYQPGSYCNRDNCWLARNPPRIDRGRSDTDLYSRHYHRV